MATREIAAHQLHAHAAPQGFIRKWVFSLDHKVIGLQYYFLALTAVFVGMFLSLLMRIHLIWPNVSLPLVGEIKPETYLSLLTMHGTIMVFFVLTTAPQGGFGNYFLPIQIGAADMAFPVLNMLSFWVTFLGYIVMLLRWRVDERTEFHHHHTGYACERHVDDAHAADVLGVVYHGDPGIARLWRTFFRGHLVAPGSKCRHQLFCAARGGEWAARGA
jgi:hypothetical protein